MGERTGIFTSGIVATDTGHQIALFFTGVRHAGENLAAVSHAETRIYRADQMWMVCRATYRASSTRSYRNGLAHAKDGTWN